MPRLAGAVVLALTGALVAAFIYFLQPIRNAVIETATSQTAASRDSGNRNPLRPVFVPGKYTLNEWLEMLRVAQKTGGSGHGESASSVLQSIAEVDPILALKLAEALGRSESETAEFLSLAMTTWAEQDPVAAWDWMRQRRMRPPHLPVSGNAAIQRIAADQMARHDPTLLVAWMSRILADPQVDGSAQGAVCEDVVHGLVQAGQGELARTALETWLRGPRAEVITGDALEKVSQFIASTRNPSDAAAWLETLPQGKAKSGAIQLRSVVWSSTEPARALEWACKLGEKGDVAVRSVFKSWMHHDVDAAIDWLAPKIEGADPTARPDRFVTIVVNECDPDDQRAVMDWAFQITNPVLKELAVDQGIRRWGNHDPSAALEYVRESNRLPEGQRKVLMRYIDDLIPVKLSAP